IHRRFSCLYASSHSTNSEIMLIFDTLCLFSALSTRLTSQSLLLSIGQNSSDMLHFLSNVYAEKVWKGFFFAIVFLLIVYCIPSSLQKQDISCCFAPYYP